MKRLVAASLVLAFVLSGSGSAAGASCPAHPLYAAQAHARAMFAGSSRIPRSEYGRQIVLIGCQRDLFEQGVVRRGDRHLHGEHAARRSYARSLASPDLADVPGVPRSFAACVAFRESTDGRLSSNVYGITSRYPGSTLPEQKATFSEMYGEYGVAPWEPYDGC